MTRYRIAAAVVALAAIAIAAVIYFAEPFETTTCYAANGASTDCSGVIVDSIESRDEDLGPALGVLAGGLLLAAGVLFAGTPAYEAWRARGRRRDEEHWANWEALEPPENNSLAAWGYVFAILFPLIGILIGVMLVSRNDRRGNGVLILSLIIIAVFVVLLAQSGSDSASDSLYTP